MAHCVIREEEQDKSVEERREENHNCAGFVCICQHIPTRVWTLRLYADCSN